MSQFFQIHPENPQARLIRQAVDIIQGGGLIVYPTDSCYALGCQLGDKDALERIRRIRQLDEKHHFTLMCRNIGQISFFAQMDNAQYRLVKSATPGPYTWILAATKEVPKRLWHPKKSTIGVRIPAHPVAQALLEELGEPLLSSTLLLPGEDVPPYDPYDIRSVLEHHVDLVIDGGYCGTEPTTVIDLSVESPVVHRVGSGDLARLGLSESLLEN